MPSNDDMGSRGEAIFFVRITQPIGPQREPLFRPHFLGEKFPTFDYFIELIDSGAKPSYFFAQVKTTSRGYTAGVPKRLKVEVTQEDVDRMLVYPAPTYVIGIDQGSEQAFIASVNGESADHIASLPTTYPLDSGNLQRLWREVRGFWAKRKMVLKNSCFEI